MSYPLTILRAAHPGMCKHWHPVQPHPPMWLQLEGFEVHDLEHLGAVRQALASQGFCFTVQGRYRGGAHATALGADYYREGLVRRTKETFEDFASPWFEIDNDGWTPPAGIDPQADPDAAVRAFKDSLPQPYRDADCLVRLSGSMGSPFKPPGELRARLTFQLAQPMTSAQKRAITVVLARAGHKVDPSICDPIQPDFIGLPDTHGHYDRFVGQRFRPMLRGSSRLLHIDPPVIEQHPRASTAGAVACETGPCPEWHGPADDAELVALGLAQPLPFWAAFAISRGQPVATFKDFWHGNIVALAGRFPSKSDKPFDASEADYGLCRNLAFLTGRDRGRILRLREQSGIYPFIKDDPRYIERTIDRACADQRAVLGQHLKPGEQADAAGIGGCNDEANASRLMRLLGGHVMAVGGKPYTWDHAAGLWVEGRGALYTGWSGVPAEVMREAAFLMSEAAKGGADEAEHRKRAEALSKWAVKCRNTAPREAAIGWLLPLIEREADELDADPHLLNVRNGIVDLRTGELLPSDPDLLMTRQCLVEFDPRADQGDWLAAARDIFGDHEMVDFMQKLFGYSITGETSAQILPIHLGGGANGKSLTMGLLSRVLGGYASTASADLLMSKPTGGPQPELVDLRGARLVVASESKATDRMDERGVKALTGSDRVCARGLYSHPVEYMPAFTVHLATNHLPEVSGTDHGLWRRLLVLPYESTFGSATEVGAGVATHIKDSMLAERLGTPEALRGLLAWLIEGARRWYSDRDLTPPPRVRAAGAVYRL